MKMRWLGGIVLPAALCLSCGKPTWQRNEAQLWADYRAAVEDAQVATAEEISHDLPAITRPGENPEIEWRVEDGRTFVLVGSMMSGKEVAYWLRDSLFRLDDRLPWVTLPYDFAEHLRRQPACGDSTACRMRMLQMLGLPPDCDYDHMVFFYAERDSLFRPSPDPEIDDSEAALDFPEHATAAYRAWFEGNRRFSYESATPYPWTRLGYTYDWNREAESVVGPGEFIVRPAALIRLKRVVPVWTWYREVR